MRAANVHTRAAIFHAQGVLRIVRAPLPAAPAAPGQPSFVYSHAEEGLECFIALWDDGSVTALHGHVDLGTGLRTALTQIVAEELSMSPARVHLLMGLTDVSPNQGATIASASLQVHAAPLRAAAAQAAQWLLQQASHLWGKPVKQLRLCPEGIQADTERAVPWGNLLTGLNLELALDIHTPFKPLQEHTVSGESLPRVDIPAKVFGELVFVHDMRVPGMLHGRVVRPPYAGADSGDFIGRTLERVDTQSIAHVPGIRSVVVQADFVGIVAEREEYAEQAMRELHVVWKPWPGIPDVSDVEQAIRRNPSTARQLVNEGDVDQALADASQHLQRTY
ncbi:MAG: molybdopterin cofactor-binding domain-containing protein, partial [Burkholderiales bacterium]